MMRFRQIKGVLLAVLFAGVPVAEANIIEIGFTAEVSHIDDGGLLEGVVSLGDMVTGRYIYDSETLDTSLMEGVGQYPHYAPPYGVTIVSGPFTFQTDPSDVYFGIGILNNHDGGDSYAFGSHNNLPLSNGVAVFGISWQLDDYSGMALSSDALLLGPPILEDWEYDRGLRVALGERGTGRLQFDVTSVWLIPEPATVFLLGLGALVLLGIRRRG